MTINKRISLITNIAVFEGVYPPVHSEYVEGS